MQKKLVAYVFTGLLVMSIMMAMVPTAQAQVAPSQVTIDIDPFRDPIRPMSGTATSTGSVAYSYHLSGGGALGATQVNLRVVEAPPWASVTVSPSSLFFEIDGQPGAGQTISAGSQSFRIFIATTSDAPAFQPASLRVQASAVENQPIDPSTAEDSIPIEADFFSVIDAQVAQPIRVVRPQTNVEFPVTITNFGNAQTRATISMQQVTEGLQVPTPQPVTLHSEQMGGDAIQATVPISLETPFRNGYMNQPGLIDAMIKATYALDTSREGDSLPVSVLVTTKGFYVPGAGLLALLGALGVSAFVLPRSGALQRK
jgi:hypothetical protein